VNTSLTRHIWGAVTIDRWQELHRQGVNLHVFYRGEDVTLRCQFADDTPGQQRAELFRLDPDGKKFVLLDRAPAMELVTTDIEIREGAPFA
jgi:hypothetical protein